MEGSSKMKMEERDKSWGFKKKISSVSLLNFFNLQNSYNNWF